MSIFVKEKKVITCPLECPMSILLICPNVLYQVSDCIWIKLVYALPCVKGKTSVLNYMMGGKKKKIMFEAYNIVLEHFFLYNVPNYYCI